MKKIFMFLLAITTSSALWAYDFKVGNLYYNAQRESDNYTVEVTYDKKHSYSNYAGITEVVIPETVSYNGLTYKVTSIGERAFCNCKSLRSINLPNTIVSIDEFSFWGCSSLTSVAFPNKLKSIERYAFEQCYSLTNIVIPKDVINIGERAFGQCASINSIVVEDDNAKYDSRNNCNAIIETMTNTLIAGCKSTTIPDGIITIGDCAFYGCTSLNSISIPNSVNHIGSEAFYNTGIYNNASCWDKDVLYIDNNLIEARTSISGSYNIKHNTRLIADGSFAGCHSLRQITIPNSVISIGNGAFCKTSIISINIPNSVTFIGDYAFGVCVDLKSIKLPNKIKSIGDKIFYSCYSLNSITIPDSVENIGIRAFHHCIALTSIKLGKNMTNIGDYAFNECISLQSVTIPNSLISIGREAFADCSSLSYISIGKNIMKIGAEAFKNTKIYNNISNWENDVLYIGNCLIEAKKQIHGTYTIKNDTRIVADEAFRECSLTSIIIPNTMRSIGKRAFWNCSCLASVAIPKNVINIGDEVVRRCPSLYSIVVEKGNIKYDSRNDCNAIIETATNTLLAGCHNSIIPDDVETIGDVAFMGCSSLVTIDIPCSVKNIGNHAFEGCTALKEIYIPYNLKESFRQNKNLEKYMHLLIEKNLPIETKNSKHTIIIYVVVIFLIVLLIISLGIYFKK